MSFRIIATPNFIKELKPLVKKYPSLKSEIQRLRDELIENPTSGTALGKDCYKIRLSIASKGRGKSGGARVITYLIISEQTIFLLSIYDKSEQADIAQNDLVRLIEKTKTRE